MSVQIGQGALSVIYGYDWIKQERDDMDEVMEIEEDDLLAITAAAILYVQFSGDTGVGASLGRVGRVMAFGKGNIMVKRSSGAMDPSIKARLTLAEMVMEARISG